MARNSTGDLAEAHTVGRLSGRGTAGSGAIYADGDIILDDWRLENKSTVKTQIILTLQQLIKVTYQCLSDGRKPALSFQFTDDRGLPREDGAWVAIPEREFIRLRDLDKEHEE